MKIFDLDSPSARSARGSEGRYSNLDVRRVASAICEGTSMFWKTHLSKVSHLLESGWTGLLFAVARRYDETPLSLRVAVEEDPNSPRQGQTHFSK